MSAARRRKKIRKRAAAMLAIAEVVATVAISMAVLRIFTDALEKGLRTVAELERARREARATERMPIGVPAFDDLPPGVSRS